MSDNYEVDGVKVTVVGGGYYELSHSTLSEPERVRGKEAADQRAAEIAKSAKGDTEGHMQQQAPLEQVAGQGGAPAEGQGKQGDSDEVAKLKKQLEEANARNAELEKASKQSGGGAAADDKNERQRVTGAMPRKFDGEMSADTRKMLKDMNLGTVKIVLEENDDIPPTGLFLQHNGRPFVIQAGIEVEVPEFLIDILDHAKMSTPVVDSKSQKVLGYRDRLRYPYRKVD